MSVATAIENLSGRIQDAYTALSAKGATMPADKNSYNLSSTIDTVVELKAQDMGTIYADRSTDSRTGAANVKTYTKTIVPDSGYNGISSIQFVYKTYLNKNIIPSTSDQVFERPLTGGNVGYEKISVSAVNSSIDSNIQAGNIKNGVTILGVTGTMQGAKTEQSKTVTPTAAGFTVSPDSGNVLTSVIINGDGDLVAGNIKKDVQIFGVTGTYEGSGGGSNNVYMLIGHNDVYLYAGGTIEIDGTPIQTSHNMHAAYNVTGKTVRFYNYTEAWNYYCILYDDGTYQEENGILSPIDITLQPTKSFNLYFNTGSICLDGNTKILLSNNIEKKISELSIDDKIMTLNPDTMQLEEDELTYCDSNEHKYWTEKDIWTFDDGTQVTTIHPHEFYNVDKQKFMYIVDFNIGDRILKVDGATPRLASHENIKENVRHFTLFTKKYNNYFANGILTGNRHSAQIKIGKA